MPSRWLCHSYSYSLVFLSPCLFLYPSSFLPLCLTSRRTHAADFVTLLKRLPHYFSMHNALQTFLYFMPHSESLLAVVASVVGVVFFFFLLVAWPTHKPLKFLWHTRLEPPFSATKFWASSMPATLAKTHLLLEEEGGYLERERKRERERE